MTDIVFKYAVDQEVGVQSEEGGRYSKATVISRVPCEPHVLYWVLFATSKEKGWVFEDRMRSARAK